MAMLALGAFGAGAAHALDWTIEGSTLAEKGLTEQSTAGSKGSLTLAGKILGSSTKLTCAVSSSGNIVKGGTGQNTLSLSGCEVPEPAKCTVTEPITLAARSELVLIGGDFAEKWTPDGEKFGSVKISNCSIAGTYPIKGSVVGKDVNFRTQQETHTLEFSSAISEAAGTELTWGGKPATLTGTTREYLTNSKWWGTNKASAWGHSGKEWTIGSKTLGELGLGSEAIGSNIAPVKFNWNYLGGNVVIECGMKMSGTVVKGGTGTAKLNLSSCVMPQPSGCQVNSSMETEPLKTSLSEVGGKWYVKVESAGEKIISVWVGGCSIAGTYPWKGSFSGLAESSGTQLSLQPLAFSAANDSAAGTSITAGGAPVNITSTQLLSLSGKN